MKRREFLAHLAGAGLLATASPLPARLTSEWGDAEAGREALPRLLLEHASSAAVEVYLQGAHVSSWRGADGEDRLFLSQHSRFEPGVPIRGGIPVVFPQFADLGSLPSHGLVRTLAWQVTESGLDSNGGAYALFQRVDDETTRAHWPHSFRTELRVTLDEALTTRLRVTNTGTSPFTFQAALHTYHRVGDVRQLQIEGLQGIGYLDRTAGGAPRAAEADPLRIKGETDRVYLNAPDRLLVRDLSSARTIAIEKAGFADAVVWNPWLERARAMEDLGAEEYAFMLCVEPANVALPTRLEPGQAWSGTQRLRVQ